MGGSVFSSSDGRNGDVAIIFPRYASWESGNRQDNPPLRAKDAVKQLWRFKTLWGNRGACHKAAPYWLQDFLKSVEFATLSYNLDRIK